jgi:hypothetical protein
MTLLQTAPKKQALPQIRQQRSLVRGVNLRQNANVLSPSSFQARKAYMVEAYKEGKFLADPESRGKPRPNPMSDPAAMEGMMGMMKGNMAMMIPQTLIMGWINAFFSGFVISKSCDFPFWYTRANDCVLLRFPSEGLRFISVSSALQYFSAAAREARETLVIRFPLIEVLERTISFYWCSRAHCEYFSAIARKMLVIRVQVCALPS